MIARIVLGLLLAAPLASTALAYEHCFSQDVVCARYDWQPDDAYVDAQTLQGVTVGAGRHGSGDFIGTETHVFVPGGTYAFAYEGEWMGGERTLVGVGVAGTRVVWFQMDERATEYPRAYHCTTVWPFVHKCGPGLP